MSTDGQDEILLSTEGHAAHVTLNRPRALNALTHAMVLRIDEALSAWERDPAVETVVIRGAGERGLCAGGDIRSIYEDARTGGTASADFWRDEYRLNAHIARYRKPYVALMDGIVMGGGVGVSAHGTVRIVTERSRVAMPETGIGFVPDVGGTYLLALAPGLLGTHLALTGASVGAADALLCGLADQFVPAGRLDAFTADLARLPVRDALARHVAEPPPGELAARRPWIDHCYAAGTVEEIIDRLLTSGETEAKETAGTLAAKSPTALKVTLAALRRARELGSLERVLEQEYRVSCAALGTHDLVEGIRAQVIDKDRTPHWSPATLAEVTDDDVARYFAVAAAGRSRTQSPHSAPLWPGADR
ncbi:enoyl-CoA hydratase/isomerase family protein [Streptomyces sp. NBC_00083]|uniref:enoyl-CoA hydratase/isomerase family protein n=1 Tax=Streptomyces sp. NBC_00083 TaxID=2975647 RepID=UPI0022510044|nr:enoyl-CoA hydratase/isomerase family protein [Streptomyces sp. NBC_00083]MCX5384150.1 enoyl-CoA hydratase/isomerase family protein [Streptomyces sp. NBC_00083]